ncbi:PAS domain-containing protein [Fusibacter ferrireducens]|uniref:PAS domain-containing protein n=1 Tax=Fusibacter ferrireducens TaxID=2785058 RepID=A0ABR9ZTT1_9FIRM|nr:PAS domain-containing protein [Fusibacter ferrireducens]MBF4693857.1 PAS domain-containing protein [Fusibacter ferrireducens]
MFKKIDDVVSFFSQLNKPIVILDRHRVIAINSILAELFSVEGHLLIGKTILDFSPEFQENNLPSDRLAHEYINKAYEIGHVDFSWIHTDVFLNSILCTVNLNQVQIGNSNYLVGMLENIKYIPKLAPEEEKKYLFNSIRIRTLLNLKAEDQQRLFNIAKLPMCISNFDGSILEVNNAWKKILKGSPETPENNYFLDFIHPEDRDRTQKAFSVLSKGHDLYLFKNKYQSTEGDYKTIRWSIFSYKIASKIFIIAEILD